jgi:hypothetical protein
MASKKFVVKNVRCNYPALDAPKLFKGQEEKDAKYSITMLIPKTDKGAHKALVDFLKESVNSTDLKKPLKDQAIKQALDTDKGFNDYAIVKDGDEINARRADEGKSPVEGYEGHYVVKAAKKGSFGMPGVYGQDAKPMQPGDIKTMITSGFWVNVEVSAYVYSTPKVGVSLQLSAVQLVKRDTAFGQSNPFDAVESVDENGDALEDSPF